MNFNLPGLHDRYSTQAQWTEELRQNLLRRIDLPAQPLVLEVGSGTGCITSWASEKFKRRVWGVDIDYPTVQFAHQTDQLSGYAQADGGSLPFPDDAFDLVFSHFLLLWTPNPIQILREMKRCVRQKGWVIAFAEPDYGGRIDYPASLARIGDYQSEALRRRGAHPSRGRELRGLFSKVGLHDILVGLLGGEWGSDSVSDQDSEWAVLQVDLDEIVSPLEFTELKKFDQEAWENQERVLFTPTFYGIGQKNA